MVGLGTIVNIGTVLAGTTVGLLLKNGLPGRFERTITQALGLCTFFIGIGGAVSGLVTVSGGALGTQHTMLLVLCMMLGALIGEALDIERRLAGLGAWCQARFAGGEDSRFVEGFVTASLLFCVGAMAIVGSLEDGLNGDPTILVAKAILDGVAAIVFAASLGKGVYLSVLALGVYQGGITLLAGAIRPWLSDALISQISCIGSVLIFALGFNLMFDKKVKVGNLLPAMFLPIVFYFLGRFWPALGAL
ncbi:MAG: DUF554 domain-containing protein [Agathobaculum sp.]|uniref:DUF554 domain-containing protein n=1 Tax=Agathobaculum sp. TaxID=2048138 RepID=UPI0025C73D08|nr:DUF554 domain-containing protein [Agathobaculum sp.]MCI7125008.1 DUF554 domain-containing protein [Agathobaculum sp.]MDY3710885.1 DUF554 domain-containing protein [Agathobaculum sp.]